MQAKQALHSLFNHTCTILKQARRRALEANAEDRDQGKNCQIFD